MARISPAVLAALVLALGACGGDSGGDEPAGSGTTPGEQATTTEPSTTTERGTAAKGDRSKPDRSRRESGDVPELDPDANREPVPKGSVPPDQRTGKPPRYTRENPIPKDQLKALERPIFEQSRYLCRRLGIEGMRREYRIESSDPEAVAREVARRTYLPETRDAVFAGCLAGLHAGD